VEKEMKLKTQPKIDAIVKSLVIIILAAVFFLIFEPAKMTKVSFAIPQLDLADVNNSAINAEYQQIEKDINSYSAQQKSRAPEPSTLFLILSGTGAMIVRFAQNSFRRFKRLLDLTFTAIGLFITAPILLFSALLIKLTSKGPILYKQHRVGRKGEVFEIYKLRTMVRDAEKDTGAVWAKENDPRITSLGRLLRKTRIDEIPQFINVLKGEMSIVGPRPERPEMVRDFKKLIGDYEKRLNINPGITGIAQIYHKYDESLIDVKKKVKYDLLYSRKMSASTDLAILAQTCLVVLTGKGAR